jgi:hypothetical protein
MIRMQVGSGDVNFGWSAGSLFRACGLLLSLLLMLGASLSARADQIHKAVFKGDLNRVVALLKDHPDLVEEKDSLGQTPLIVAVNHNKLEIAELLLANGANVNARDSHMHTPLMVALGIYNHDKMVRLLLAKGADVNLADDSGMTPIAYSVRQGQMEDVKVLLANDANVNVVTGSSPLNLAILAHRIEMVELLLANGADVNYKSRDLTPLRYAKLADETRIEALLKKYGGHE